jgi:hypothetical protein
MVSRPERRRGRGAQAKSRRGGGGIRFKAVARAGELGAPPLGSTNGRVGHGHRGRAGGRLEDGAQKAAGRKGKAVEAAVVGRARGAWVR